ncbi:sugar phosphate isomerase/epimerase family protein [Urbifossiella limnaea]|uniref:D-tagatose 3-epimerase n=1 Tax=Urbifossiella limnaea TaxID=2528023 RepID=A0A517XVF0_9BACT|nr:sugar phosphate isomerase/epimerase family protein [Urbifossiella limnaea]QDU21454.1 D-tagatose 3-epimerase [Urbifossiella limnaea]
MKYAICNETFEGWDHARVCARAAEFGYTGLEVAPFTLAPLITDVSAARRTELRRQAEAAGVSIIGLHWLLAKTTGFHLTSPDAAVRKKTGEYLAELTRATADLGGTLMVLGSPFQRNLDPGVSTAEGDDRAVDTLSHCLKALEDGRVTLCLEPLTTAETNYLTTAAEGTALCRRVAHPFVKLHLDVKAMSSEPAPVADTIRANREFFHHFHANDPNLRGPGFGATDFRPIFRALADVNYTGWVSVEVFDYKPDADTIARESIRYMRECAP